MTYGEAKANGYKDTYTAYQRGYVSRKIDINNQPVITTRRGKQYVLCPCWHSTTYCVRQYIER